MLAAWADDYRARVFGCETCLPLDDARSPRPQSARTHPDRRPGIRRVSARIEDDPLRQRGPQAAALEAGRSRVLESAPLAARARPARDRRLHLPRPEGVSPSPPRRARRRSTIVPSGYGDITGRRRGGAPYTCTNQLVRRLGVQLLRPDRERRSRSEPPRSPWKRPRAPTRHRTRPSSPTFEGWSRSGVPERRGVHLKRQTTRSGSSHSSRRCGSRRHVNGPGTTRQSANVHCAVDRCVIGLFDAGTRVTVTAQADDGGRGHHIGIRLRPVRERPWQRPLSSSTCPTSGTSSASRFDGFEPGQSPPFNKAVTLKVQRAGDGEGQVEGSGKSADLNAGPWKIECGTTCDVKGIQFQTQVRLRAVKSGGLRLRALVRPALCERRHLHVHSRQVPEGRRGVQAGRVLRRCHRPNRGNGGRHGCNGCDRPGREDLKASVLSAAATGKGRSRAIVTRVQANAAARATLRLLRNGKTLARKSFAVAAGTSRLSVPVRQERQARVGLPSRARSRGPGARRPRSASGSGSAPSGLRQLSLRSIPSRSSPPDRR